MNQIHVSKELGAAITSARLAHGMKSVQQLAEKIGLSQNTMWRIEKGNVRTSEENLNKLKEILNIEWRKKPTGKEEQKEGYRTIPEYNVRVSAGHGEFTGIEEIKQNLQMPKIFLPENGQVGFVRVEGDSMTPTIAHGDYVAVEFDSGYTSDGLYLIRIDDAVFVKRLQRKFGGVRIISDNSQYDEMTVSPDDGNDFGLIGRVALVIRKT